MIEDSLKSVSDDSLSIREQAPRVSFFYSPNFVSIRQTQNRMIIC